MSNAKTKFVYVTFISSTPEKVFEALTNSAITKQYWGHANVSDWKPGSKWEHVRDNAERKVKITGTVVENSSPKRLVISWSSPADFADAAKHSRVTFDLESYGSMVKLTMTHDDLIEGSDMLRGVSKGWPVVLSSLKSLLETGKGLDVFAQPKSD